MLIKGADTVVTLKDSGSNGSYTTSGNIALVQDGATLKIESGTFRTTSGVGFWAGGKDQTGNIVIGDENGGPTIIAQEFAIGAGKNSKVTINAGSLTAKDNAVVGDNGSAGYEGAEFVINGGTFKGEIQSNGYTGCGVYLANNGKLTINGGEFTVDGVGVCARAGEVEINGGSFVSTVTSEGWVGDRKTQVSANGVYYDGAAKYPGLAENAKVTINGGTFTNSADSTTPALKVVQPDNGITVAVNNNANWTVA